MMPGGHVVNPKLLDGHEWSHCLDVGYMMGVLSQGRPVFL